LMARKLMVPATLGASSGGAIMPGNRYSRFSFRSRMRGAKRKPSSRHMAKTKIRETSGIGVMLVDDKAALVIKQSVENVGRFVSGRSDHLGVIGPKLIA